MKIKVKNIPKAMITKARLEDISNFKELMSTFIHLLRHRCLYMLCTMEAAQTTAPMEKGLQNILDLLFEYDILEIESVGADYDSQN